MKLFLRFGNALVIILFLILVYIALDHFNYLPQKSYTDSDFNVDFIESNVDKDNDGVDDYSDILTGAKEFVSKKPKYKSSYYTKVVYDEAVNIVQEFQSKVIKAIVQILSEKNKKTFLKLFYDREFGTNRLVHQYLELIDCRYLAKNKENRLKGLVNTTKRVIRYWEYQEYIDLEQELIEYAEENKCNIDNIIIDGTEYPEEIDW